MHLKTGINQCTPKHNFPMESLVRWQDVPAMTRFVTMAFIILIIIIVITEP